MKENLIIMITAFFWVSCSHQTGPASTEKKDSAIYYPYTPIYSEFEPGNPLYSKKVLEIWRQFETGSLFSVAGYFADSLTLVFKDHIYNGARDSVLAIFKKRRDVYSDVQCYIDSWMPVHAKQTNDDLVLLWGRQDCTKEKNKSRDYLVVHEVWRFDKKGKVRAMLQYLTHPF